MRTFLLFLLRKIVLLPSYALVLLVRLCKWLIAPPVLLLQMVIGVPLALLRIRQPTRPRFIPLTDAELPDQAWIAITDVTEALAADGFISKSTFRCDELIHDTTLWLRLLIQPDQGISVISALIEFKSSQRPNRSFTEFSTTFDDGRVLDTNNFCLPYSLPAPAYLARLQLKDVWDARALYVLHRELIASLAQAVDLSKIDRANRDPMGLLTDSYTREIQALIAQGWLHLGTGNTRLTLRGALMGVWRQAWPLTSLYLRNADHHARQLLAEHGIDTDEFTGSALSIVVDRQPLPVAAGTITTVWAGYEYVRSLALHTDPNAVLEAVVAELAHDQTGTTAFCELRYSFRSHHYQHERRIHRLRSFDILLDPEAGWLAVTAMEREVESVPDPAQWSQLTNRPQSVALRPGPWLCDLDTILPAALQALNSRAGVQNIEPDSASLYIEDGTVYWQIVAWTENETPLHVIINARTGVILED